MIIFVSDFRKILHNIGQWLRTGACYSQKTLSILVHCYARGQPLSATVGHAGQIWEPS
jgi:hypothetical protein